MTKVFARELSHKLPEPAPVRHRLRGHERRAEILTAATKVFHRKGYEAASLQDIADELGIRKASLFYYFPSKEELLHEVLASIISRGIANLRQIMAVPADPLTVLWRLVAGHILHLCEYLEETAVFLHERKSIPAEKRHTVLADDHTYQNHFVETIREAQAAGLIRPDVDPKLAALSVLGSANWTYTWFRRSGSMKPEVIGEQFATMSVNGLASPKALETWRKPSLSKTSLSKPPVSKPSVSEAISPSAARR
ncbi:MAG: TetR family transcriptional regulator [Chelatococcus sp.]|uniref:TetR/AcrR family transcriptional regulator n=1 Tax=Chelatococcus sp. TaxID=1953771 RepID=UPI0025BABDB1|nr:TetR/AcrR family transcriptional regulator [Chelatococcus sp.]MBX3539371.1 TetR family transcriptional regulator [Chelatococcus sp.]